MNRIPILGWIASFFVNLCLSIPFWFVWSVCGIGKHFFFWLPEPFHSPSLWAVLGLFICVEILRNVLLPFTVPKWMQEEAKD